MYNDLVLRNVASFLYFWDNIDRFCAFVSSSVTKDMLNENYKLNYNMWGNSLTLQCLFSFFLIVWTISKSNTGNISLHNTFFLPWGTSIILPSLFSMSSVLIVSVTELKFTVSFLHSFSDYFNYTLSSFFSTGTTQLNDESACENAGDFF